MTAPIRGLLIGDVSGHRAAAAVALTLMLGVVGCGPTSDAGSSAADATIECRHVPEELCMDYAEAMMEGPQPDYASAIDRVVVTCERLPPCGPDRPDSGGKIMILYDNGWAWTQDWAVMSGV